MSQQAVPRKTLKGRMREMETRLEELAKGEQEHDLAMRALESCIIARVDAALIEVDRRIQEMDAKVNGPVAKMMETMALDQIDLKAKLDRAMAPLLQSIALDQMELKAKLDRAMAPLLQSIALDQMELKAKLDRSVAPLLKSLAMEHIDLKAKIAAAQPTEAKHVCETNTSADHIVSPLRADVEALRAGLSDVCGEIKAFKAGMQPAEPIGTFKAENVGAEPMLSPLKSPSKVLRSTPMSSPILAKFTVPSADVSAMMVDLGPGFSYSSKSSWSLGRGEAPARMSRISRQGSRIGHRSLPQLPPVQSP